MLLQSSALLLLFLDSCLETCFKKSKQKTMLKFQLKKLKKKERETTPKIREIGWYWANNYFRMVIHVVFIYLESTGSIF